MKKHSIRFYSIVCCLMVIMLSACKKDHDKGATPQPKVTEYYPNSGGEGTLVTVAGSGFSGSVSATFAGTTADVVSVTSTAMVLRAPKGGSSGNISLKLDNASLTVGKYTYQDLSISKISPANGTAGAHIRVSGSGFSSTSGPAVVTINGKTTQIVSASDTLLVVEVPANVGTGQVKVSVNGKDVTGQNFKYQIINAIKPLTGGKGTIVRVDGDGFENTIAGNTIDFNGKQAVVKEAAVDHIIVVAPDAVQTGPLSVTINGQKIVGPVFTVVPLPVIQTVTPLSGPAGTIMTIVGTTFSNIVAENKVTINGVAIPVTSATATKLTLTIPGGTGNGKVVVSVNEQAVQGPDFKDQSLGVTALTPASGLAGTHVIISGLGFNTAAGQNKVTFNGVAAIVVSATVSSLEVIAPQGLTTGPVKVTSNGVDAFAPSDFQRAGVITLAGGPGNSSLELVSYRSGSLAVDGKGNVYVIEVEKNRIKKIATNGTVTLFAGSPTGERGYAEGQGDKALFNLGANPGMDIDEHDNLYVSDGTKVRKITPQGMVSTFVSNLGTINKMAFDETGILYVMGSFNGAWRIDKEGNRSAVSILASQDDSRPAPYNGFIYKVGNEGYYIDAFNLATSAMTYRWVGGNFGSSDGIGSGASLGSLNGLVSDRAGTIYISEAYNRAIRKINIATREVTTIVQFAQGANVDGAFNQVKSGSLGDITMDRQGNIYFIDMTNNAVRKIFLK
ncbi:IPT/TIG domain-containing protein [Mucilaginibacter pocheonensis]|uniref:Sugar lactone lactonase YvrE n=1 Tax=Mucilaginibacter pocheonensis TaxID=398050 RepID=A0ABU1TFY4_9SPHI|nr:IPT/TIG domain-containing protein [Mucilaginibacter pocheonensis]MDR6944219.1 sugar lactone lactonase YvrE [Mucilaginibacter pocheonensis]